MPGRGRVMLALATSLMATALVTVPLAYQSAGADDAGGRRSGAVRSVPATSQPASVLPTVLERSGPDLRWQTATDPGPAEPLQGAVLTGSVRVSLDQENAVEASYWIDHIDPSRTPDDVDRRAPFTLEAPRARDVATSGTGSLDTRRLRNGLNAVLVRVRLSDGTSVEQIVTFVVTNPR